MKTPVLIFAAHPDDWQIFAGPAIYEHLRDPRTRVSIINLTAGDAGDDEHHWKSRHGGAVFSVLRALPSWSPYTLGGFTADPLPSGFSVSYERLNVSGKAVLRTRIGDQADCEALVYSLHLPDGGVAGGGYPPLHESLASLREGACALTSLWPEDALTTYESWEDLLAVLHALILEARGAYAGPVRAYAPDPSPHENPDDHADHRATAQAVEALAETMPFLAPVWMSMYAVANKPENLETEAGSMQRAAIAAYGGSYGAGAAAVRTAWRRGWEREMEVFKNRQYLRVEER